LDLITVDLSRKLGAGPKDSVVSRAADKLAHQPPSPERRPNRIEYTHTPDIEVPARLLERHRIAVATNNAKAADAFRLLRTQLLMQMRRNGWQTLAVTSPNQGAGKSTVSLNLAISFGMEVDYTALLVDADLRDPYLRTMLELAPGPGLGDYLVGEARLEDLLIHPNIGNLVVLPGGAPVENTAELMGSPMMVEMVRELRSRYPNRLIVFDVPANLSGADSLALSSYIDATILLVEEDRTTPDEVERACDLLRHGNLIGIVLNKSRELPDPGPSRRRRPGFFSRLFGARNRRTKLAAATHGNAETPTPGPPSNQRNAPPQRSDPSTTVSGGLSDSSRDRDPTPLALAPRMSKDTDETLLFPDEADSDAGKAKRSAALVRTPGPHPLEESARGRPAGNGSQDRVGLGLRLVWIFLAVTLVVGVTGIYLAKTERFDAIEFLKGWLVPILGHESSVPQNDPRAPSLVGGKTSNSVELSSKIEREYFSLSETASSRGEPRQVPDEHGQEIGRPLQDGGSPVELGSDAQQDAQQEQAFNRSAVSAAPRPTPTLGVTTKNAEPLTRLNPVTEASESVDTPQLAVTTESGVGFDNVIKSAESPNNIERLIRTDEVGGRREVTFAAGSATGTDEPAASQAAPVEMETVTGTEEVTENPEISAAAGSVTKADEPAASQAAPVEIEAAPGTEEVTENPEISAAAGSVTKADEPAAGQAAPVERETSAGTEEIIENSEVAVAAGSATEADEPAASQAVPVEMETATGTEEITENSEVAVAAGSATEADKPAASQVAPVEMKTAAGTEEANENPEVVGAVSATEADEPEASQVAPVEIEAAAGTEEVTENLEVAVAAGSATEADERAAQLGLYHRSVETPASEMNDDRATNLRSASTANGVQEVPVPETAGVNLPEFRDASQDRPELQPPEPEVVAPSKPPTPLQVAESAQSQLDLDRLLDRGDQLLALGDVASARLFYRLATKKGSAKGATAMGSTYDPVYLERIGIVGVRPSPAEAIKWYRQAIDMGHRGAEVQLRELTNRLERAAALGDGEAQRILESTLN
jgi:capsular exopolysaccharide synthesis family protein